MHLILDFYVVPSSCFGVYVLIICLTAEILHGFITGIGSHSKHPEISDHPPIW